MIICETCGAKNQAHYKFCLGCGADLRPTAPADTPATGSADGSPARAPSPTSPTPKAPNTDRRPLDPASAAAPAPRSTRSADVEAHRHQLEPKPADSDAANAEAETRRTCPRCGVLNPVTFKFCGGCGLNLEGDGTGAGYSTVNEDGELEGGISPTRPTDPEGPAIAQMTLVLPDGSAGGVHVVHGPTATIGRDSGSIFEADPYLSPQHLKLTHDGEALVVEDLHSLNGVYLRIRQQPLGDGAVFRIGQELLRLNLIGGPREDDDGTEIAGSPNPGFWGRLSLVVAKGRDGSAFPLYGDETILGRERGDILFYDDGYVSGAHCKIQRERGQVDLVDLDSSNGTYVRIGEPRVVPYGTMLVLGQQLFRLEPAP